MDEVECTCPIGRAVGSVNIECTQSLAVAEVELHVEHALIGLLIDCVGMKGDLQRLKISDRHLPVIF